MKGKKILAALGFFSIAGVAGGCSQPAPYIRYQIETDQPCQTMAYFSASDAWSMQFIGLWPQEKQNQVADWLCVPCICRTHPESFSNSSKIQI